MDTPHMQVFMPWFFYEWIPEPDDTAVKGVVFHAGNEEYAAIRPVG